MNQQKSGLRANPKRKDRSLGQMGQNHLKSGWSFQRGHTQKCHDWKSGTPPGIWRDHRSFSRIPLPFLFGYGYVVILSAQQTVARHQRLRSNTTNCHGWNPIDGYRCYLWGLTIMVYEPRLGVYDASVIPLYCLVFFGIPRSWIIICEVYWVV